MTPRAPEPGDLAPYRPQLSRDDSTHSKLSVPLSSQSNEADDEQSLSDPSYDMESTIDAPRYEGEDTRLTSDKELSGFYMYGWAAEVNHCYFLPCPSQIAPRCPLPFVS
jgi:UMF1 family MFS transporter